MNFYRIFLLLLKHLKYIVMIIFYQYMHIHTNTHAFDVYQFKKNRFIGDEKKNTFPAQLFNQLVFSST